jgi:multisubunit Na+/H+ antiporter MnhG subunit
MATSTHATTSPSDAGGAAKAHRILAQVFLAGAVLQFFLAGLGAFKFGDEESNAYDIHQGIGSLLTLVALILLILAFVGRKHAVQASVVLFVLMLVQNVLAWAGTDAPAVGGLHPINGLLILGVAMLTIAGRRVEVPHGGHGHGGGGAAGPGAGPGV